MARFLKTRTKVLGLHPGALVYIGESGDMERIRISLINYTKNSFLESSSATFEKCIESVQDKTQTTWIEFSGLLDKKVIEEIGNQFGIHRLWLEDILNTDHRPKIEEMDNMLFAIIKFVSLKKSKENLQIKANQMSICFSDGFILSFHDKDSNFFEPIKHRLRESIWKIRSLRADYLFCTLIDLLVDNYYIVLEQMGDYFEKLEVHVTENINKLQPAQLVALKREFLYLRKTIFPIKEALNKIITVKHPWIDSQNIRYFKDVQDHVIQIIEIIDYYGELSNSLMDFYQNTVNIKMNEIMKVLTLFAAIFIPLTFIVGIYGMNFKSIPELDWKYGYYFVWVIVFLVSGGMILLFKKKKWL